MSGEVPEIYWFLFWVGLAIVAFGSAFMAGRGGHIARMQALDILKRYAEKGVEPPPEIAASLLREISGARPARPATGKSDRTRYLEQFCVSAFIAGASAGVAWWRMDAGGEPTWLAYAAVISALAFGAGAAAALIAALVSARE